MRRIGWSRDPLLTALAAAGVALVALPLVALAVRAPWGRLAELASPRAVDALRISLAVSVSAALLTAVLGVPVAWVLATRPFRGRSLVRAVVVLPLVLPPVVGGVALLAALGRRGLLGGLLERLGVELAFTRTGAVVAAAFVSFPLLVLAAEGGFRAVDVRLEGVAAGLGASPWHRFVRVTLPLAAPQIVAGTVLAWARSLGEFGATIMFAGNLAGRTQTLPLAVYELQQTDPAGAALLSLLLVAVSLGVLIALRGRFLRPA